MYKFILILVGLYLDGFVYMMQVGATIRDCGMGKRARYSLIYTLVASGMAMIGYGVAHLFKDFMSFDLEVLVACLIIVGLGMRMVWQGAIGRSTYVEKLDKTFDHRKLFHIAVVTNIDTLVLGASFSFMGSGALNDLLLFLVFGFIAVYTALTIGYNLGASYQRQVSMSGGVLMIIFAVWVLIEYVL